MLFNLTNEQLELTSKLQQKIVRAIESTSTLSIPFSQYMNMALYDSEFGYYNNLLYKFGVAGDFITAPVVSSLFTQSIANQCMELFNHGVALNILEIGAGNGQFMLDLLRQLSINKLSSAKNNKSHVAQPHVTYYILELSASLVKLQKDRLTAELPHFLDRVIWLNELPQNFDGIIIGNEVLDAQPCELIKWQDNQTFIRHVMVNPNSKNHSKNSCLNNIPNSISSTISTDGENSGNSNSYNITNGAIEFQFKDVQFKDVQFKDVQFKDAQILDSEEYCIAIQNEYYNNEIQKVQKIHDTQGSTLSDTYISEISFANRGFIKTLAQILDRGCILLIDYGYSASEYYNSTRNLGTLRGFFRHHVMANVLQYAGLIDITASVDFSAIVNTAINNNLDFIGYTTQGNFLINCGLLELLKNNGNAYDYNYNSINGIDTIDRVNSVEYLRLTNQVNKLTSINEMGDIFKVIGFSKNIDFADWIGFNNRDLSYTLGL